MSWQSIWQTPNQAQAAQVPAANPAANPAMYSMTAEQQIAMQQNWQQWQLYQTQLAQWQAQYGEQYQQMQNKLMGITGANPFISNIATGAPPLPMDYQPPPPPPPQQPTINTQKISDSGIVQGVSAIGVGITATQNTSTSQNCMASKSIARSQATITGAPIMRQPPATTVQTQHLNENKHDKSSVLQQSSTSSSFQAPPQGSFSSFQHQSRNVDSEQDGFRRHNRNNPWNNNDNRNNRGFGSAARGGNFRPFDRDEQMNDEPKDDGYDEKSEEKSEEEKSFDIQYQKWEDSFMEWKQNNANHPDNNRYNDFVEKMEGCRKQLLLKREAIRQKRLESQQQSKQQTQSNQQIQSNQQAQSIQQMQSNQRIQFTQQMISTPQTQSNQQTQSKQQNQSNQQSQPIQGTQWAQPMQEDNEEEEEEGLIEAAEVEYAEAQEGDDDDVIGVKEELTRPALFATDVSNSEGGIPGLDLVSEENTDEYQFEEQKTQNEEHDNDIRTKRTDRAFDKEQKTSADFKSSQNISTHFGTQRQTYLEQQDFGKQAKLEPNCNIFEQVNNILGNPEIKSLLSNIQKQKSETFLVNSFEGLQRYQDQDDRMPMPFQLNNQNEQQFTHPFGDISKRGRYSNEQPPVAFPSKQEGDVSAQRPNVPMDSNAPAPDHGFDGFRMIRKRRWEPESTNASGNHPNLPDVQDFRPMQVIDYQNRSQNPAENQPFEKTLGADLSWLRSPPSNVPQNWNRNQTSKRANSQATYRSQMPVNLNNVKFIDEYPRKIIEYGHKSKIYKWDWHCPVIQIEYNHTKTGLSMHEHPPPRPTPKIIKLEPQEEWKPLRRLNWQPGSFDRPQRFSHLPQGQYYQPRSHLPPNQPEPYYKRNPADWQQNRDWNTTQSGFHDRTDQRAMPHTATCTTKPVIRRNEAKKPNPTYDVKDLLFFPGRRRRPNKIAILMRGPPGSGKSFISKLINQKEEEMGGSARLLSIEDYFMAKSSSQIASEQLTYLYEPELEEAHTQSLLSSFKKTMADNLYNFIIVDSYNTTLKHLNGFYTAAKSQAFTPFVCELPLNLQRCIKNNIHNRSVSDIRKSIDAWAPSPVSYTLLDYDCLLNSADQTEAISDAEDERSANLDAISEDENCHDVQDEDDFSDLEELNQR